ncbi:MAG: hypothetical protein J3K34DRAFT_399347 [Monoraphidium minutum]|nr:MAG: hypothetical protein J3K34DRAFT_399347 [Monoraphidium minutum]
MGLGSGIGLLRFSGRSAGRSRHARARAARNGNRTRLTQGPQIRRRRRQGPRRAPHAAPALLSSALLAFEPCLSPLENATLKTLFLPYNTNVWWGGALRRPLPAAQFLSAARQHTRPLPKHLLLANTPTLDRIGCGAPGYCAAASSLSGAKHTRP